MTENFERLETGQLELMHQQTHDKVDGGEDCLPVRNQHDNLAAELIRRGVTHDTAIVCPEPVTNAPNYQRGFTDDICINCAFGQLFFHCNLYNFQYVKDFVCDSFRYFEVLELEPPHGFLMAQEKQTALASVEKRDITKPVLIISNGEVFGIAEFEQPAQMSIKDFDSEEWQSQHRITQRERRQWWPDEKVFYVYPIKKWLPYDGIKLYKNGHVVDEPKLSARQWRIVSKSKDLPKQIILDPSAVSITEQQEFIIHDGVDSYKLNDVLSATYETEVRAAKTAQEIIPIYSLALVRNPRMRVSKKNIIAEATTKEIRDKVEDKQEDDDMPFRIALRDEEYCVINTDTNESLGCHETEAEAEAQLAALRINVEAEEDESAVHSDRDKPKRKPRSRHPKKDFSDSTIEEIIETKNQPTFDLEETEIKQFDDSEWDGSAARWDTAEAFCNDSLIDVNPSGEEKIKELCKLPFRNPGATNPNLAALRAIAGGRGITAVKKPADVSESEWNTKMKTAANRLIGWWPDAFDQPAPESIFRIAGKTRPKEKKGFVDNLRGMYKSIAEFLNIIDNEQEEDTKLFVEETGIAQKIVDGELWHFTWSTNAFEDRDGEIFSTKGLEEYVNANEKNKDRGHFNLWHINEEDGNFNSDFAKKEWQGVVGRILIEAGPYLRNEKGRAARKFFKKFYARHPQIAPEGWGCSPEYKYLPEERATGIYKNIWITRTSTLPKMAAANIWTDTQQMKIKRGTIMALSEDQRKAAVEMFGSEFVDTMIRDAQTRSTELEKAGVAHKGTAEVETEVETVETEIVQSETEVTQETNQEAAAEVEEKQPTQPPDEVTMTQDQFESLANMVAGRFQVNNESLVEAMGTIAQSLSEVGDRVATLESKGNAKEKAETPTYTFELKRASEDQETVVTDDDALKGKTPVEISEAPKSQTEITPDAFFTKK
jgi:hypothetical protein